MEIRWWSSLDARKEHSRNKTCSWRGGAGRGMRSCRWRRGRCWKYDCYYSQTSKCQKNYSSREDSKQGKGQKYILHLLKELLGVSADLNYCSCANLHKERAIVFRKTLIPCERSSSTPCHRAGGLRETIRALLSSNGLECTHKSFDQRKGNDRVKVVEPKIQGLMSPWIGFWYFKHNEQRNIPIFSFPVEEILLDRFSYRERIRKVSSQRIAGTEYSNFFI